MKCEVCGNEMVIRKNSATGETFYGCSNYPNCCHTEEEDCISKKRRIENEKKERKKEIIKFLHS